MTMILIMMSIAAVAFASGVASGVAVTCLANANKVSELEQELNNSISIDRLTHCLHDSLLPNKMKNASVWNAALLDLQQRVERAVDHEW